ncbi:MAG: GntR family transcriptional regulator, partial [Candidatus Competibacteraceae bacterium]|nr:GntR family transcriptional regulator [Candidatus Competibacteraceae bacterium]
MAKFGAVVRETLGTAVYNEIRNAILDGDFFPGDTVKIKQIAEEMGVSATPVRDALLQLVMERVLVMPSSREIRVPQISR